MGGDALLLNSHQEGGRLHRAGFAPCNADDGLSGLLIAERLSADQRIQKFSHKLFNSGCKLNEFVIARYSSAGFLNHLSFIWDFDRKLCPIIWKSP
ncbi:hypothetical protein D9M69_551920 [compost metagenome]